MYAYILPHAKDEISKYIFIHRIWWQAHYRSDQFPLWSLTRCTISELDANSAPDGGVSGAQTCPAGLKRNVSLFWFFFFLIKLLHYVASVSEERGKERVDIYLCGRLSVHGIRPCVIILLIPDPSKLLSPCLCVLKNQSSEWTFDFWFYFFK